jgi:hypothetical protein
MTAVLALALLLAAPDQSVAKKPDKHATPARIFVTTARSSDGVPSEEETGRLEALATLQEQLRGKSQFVFVQSAGEAQVVVEVINREERGMSEGGFGGASLTKFRETIIRVKVSAGHDQSDLKGVGQGSWKSAAKDLVERLSKWVNNHVTPASS